MGKEPSNFSALTLGFWDVNSRVRLWEQICAFVVPHLVAKGERIETKETYERRLTKRNRSLLLSLLC